MKQSGSYPQICYPYKMLSLAGCLISENKLVIVDIS